MFKALIKALIRFYQLFISPLKPPSCRFSPTCSQYALESIETHGALRGAMLSVRRVLRCHPFSRGGYDPVPPAQCSCANNEAARTSGAARRY
ncbi:MAG: membrane protein insertion efficiency factor YidD [Myxococcota bacterium]|jgi:hypothetical protein